MLPKAGRHLQFSARRKSGPNANHKEWRTMVDMVLRNVGNVNDTSLDCSMCIEINSLGSSEVTSAWVSGRYWAIGVYQWKNSTFDTQIRRSKTPEDSTVRQYIRVCRVWKFYEVNAYNHAHQQQSNLFKSDFTTAAKCVWCQRERWKILRDRWLNIFGRALGRLYGSHHHTVCHIYRSHMPYATLQVWCSRVEYFEKKNTNQYHSGYDFWHETELYLSNVIQ